jgi:hypothetical protein
VLGAPSIVEYGGAESCRFLICDRDTIWRGLVRECMR